MRIHPRLFCLFCPLIGRRRIWPLFQVGFGRMGWRLVCISFGTRGMGGRGHETHIRPMWCLSGKLLPLRCRFRCHVS